MDLFSKLFSRSNVLDRTRSDEVWLAVDIRSTYTNACIWVRADNSIRPVHIDRRERYQMSTAINIDIKPEPVLGGNTKHKDDRAYELYGHDETD